MSEWMTAEELGKRYNITKAAALNMVRDNLEALNAKGENAIRVGAKKEWRFNVEAVRILDRLRGVGAVVIEEVPSQKEQAQESPDFEHLRMQYMVLQQQMIETQKKLSEVLEEKPLLIEARAKQELEAELARKDAETKLAMAEKELELAQKEAELVRTHADSEMTMLRESKDKEMKSVQEKARTDVDRAYKTAEEQLKRISENLETKNNKIADLEKNVSEKEAKIAALEAELQAQKSKGFFARLFG